MDNEIDRLITGSAEKGRKEKDEAKNAKYNRKEEKRKREIQVGEAKRIKGRKESERNGNSEKDFKISQRWVDIIRCRRCCHTT